jgi:hypothetical protein
MDGWMDGWYINGELEKFGRRQSWSDRCIVLESTCKGLRKTMKNSG